MADFNGFAMLRECLVLRERNANRQCEGLQNVPYGQPSFFGIPAVSSQGGHWPATRFKAFAAASRMPPFGSF